MAKVVLHRCPFKFIRTAGHGCNNVEAALNEAGIEHEIKNVWAFPRGLRKEVKELSGQTVIPIIEFEDGSAWRADSTEIVAAIEAGTLFEHAGGPSG